MQGDTAIILFSFQFVQFVVKTKIEQKVNKQLPQIASIPLQHTRQQQDKQGISPDASYFMIV